MKVSHRFLKLLDNIWESPHKDFLLPISLQFGALLIFGFFYIGCAYQENAVQKILDLPWYYDVVLRVLFCHRVCQIWIRQYSKGQLYPFCLYYGAFLCGSIRSRFPVGAKIFSSDGENQLFCLSCRIDLF